MSALLEQDPATTDVAPVPLTAVCPGQTARVHEVRDPEARKLLRSLGLISTSRFRLCQIGDPCIIQVGATRIGLSREVAAALFVLPESVG
jgi:Fe2+ transport system protein FeoA